MKKIYLLFAVCSLLFVAGCGDLSDGGPSGKSYKTGNNSVITDNLRAVSYSSLPGWREDDVRYALQAFRNSCKAKLQYKGKIVPDRALMEEKCANLPSASASADTIRKWFEDHFQPYQVFDDSGKSKGTFTGYYSPMISACKTKTAECNEPLMGVPLDGCAYKGVEKRKIVEQNIGRVLYWANIVDVQNIQIQGSGVLKLKETGETVKLNFAAVNDMPFKSVGEQLRLRGIRPADGYSADAVWTHLKANPALAKEVIYNNPRYVYFYVSDKSDVIGKIGTPLSKIRSVAMDDTIYALGVPVYINTNLSDGRKFQRLMIAQDTGGAIRDWIRVDIFFGTGDEAYKMAHGQHAQGEKFIFLPKEYGR